MVYSCDYVCVFFLLVGVIVFEDIPVCQIEIKHVKVRDSIKRNSMNTWINWVAVCVPVYIAGAVAGNTSFDNFTVYIIGAVCSFISMTIYSTLN